MQTELIRIDRTRMDREVMERAGALLRGGSLVAFPTETVYGLGANALDEEAAKKIYAAKGRPSDNPLIVHIAELEALEGIAAQIPKEAWMLAEAFWPGPLTMIFHKKDRVPWGTTGGLATVAVRMPSDEIAGELIRQGGGYIAAPSANVSGRPSPTTAEHVYEDMKGRIPLILDGGPVPIGLESTIVDLTEDCPVILRPGYITLSMIQEVKCIGSRRDELSIASHLFQVLREFDGDDVDRIYSESFDTPGLGQAIMNRLLKAAGHHKIHV